MNQLWEMKGIKRAVDWREAHLKDVPEEALSSNSWLQPGSGNDNREILVSFDWTTCTSEFEFPLSVAVSKSQPTGMRASGTHGQRVSKPSTKLDFSPHLSTRKFLCLWQFYVTKTFFSFQTVFHGLYLAWLSRVSLVSSWILPKLSLSLSLSLSHTHTHTHTHTHARALTKHYTDTLRASRTREPDCIRLIACCCGLGLVNNFHLNSRIYHIHWYPVTMLHLAFLAILSLALLDCGELNHSGLSALDSQRSPISDMSS